eukprot:1156505-Pelagomonas_calceolata.AAC.7
MFPRSAMRRAPANCVKSIHAARSNRHVLTQHHVKGHPSYGAPLQHHQQQHHKRHVTAQTPCQG